MRAMMITLIVALSLLASVVVATTGSYISSEIDRDAMEPYDAGTYADTERVVTDGEHHIRLSSRLEYVEVSDQGASSVAWHDDIYYTSGGRLHVARAPTGEETEWVSSMLTASPTATYMVRSMDGQLYIASETTEGLHGLYRWDTTTDELATAALVLLDEPIVDMAEYHAAGGHIIVATSTSLHTGLPPDLAVLDDGSSSASALDWYPYNVRFTDEDGETWREQVMLPRTLHQYIQETGSIAQGRAEFLGTYDGDWWDAIIGEVSDGATTWVGYVGSAVGLPIYRAYHEIQWWWHELWERAENIYTESSDLLLDILEYNSHVSGVHELVTTHGTYSEGANNWLLTHASVSEDDPILSGDISARHGNVESVLGRYDGFVRFVELGEDTRRFATYNFGRGHPITAVRDGGPGYLLADGTGYFAIHVRQTQGTWTRPGGWGTANDLGMATTYAGEPVVPIAAGGAVGYAVVQVYAADGAYVSMREKLPDEGTYITGINLSWDDAAMGTGGNYTTQVSRDGGSTWINVTSGVPTTWTQGDGDTDHTWLYRHTMDGDGYGTPSVTGHTWEIEYTDDVYIEDLGLSRENTAFDTPGYYTCGWCPDSGAHGELWSRPLDLRVVWRRNVMDDTSPYLIEWDWGDPHALDQDYIAPVCPDGDDMIGDRVGYTRVSAGEGFRYNSSGVKFFTQPGTYTVNVTVYQDVSDISQVDNDTVSASEQHVVEILNQPPVITGVGPSHITAEPTTTHDVAISAYDHDGIVEEYGFGDGAHEVTGPTSPVTWTAPDAIMDREVHAFAVDDRGDRSWDTDYGGVDVVISDGPLPPHIVVTVTPDTTVELGTEQIFDGSGSYARSGGEIVNWTWDMGDGTVYYGVDTTTHTYSDPGPHTARLTLLDDLNATRSWSTPITVTMPGGPWIVDREITVTGWTWTQYYDIIVTDTGHLTLDTCLVRMHQETDHGDTNIYVQGGTLTLVDTVITGGVGVYFISDPVYPGRVVPVQHKMYWALTVSAGGEIIMDSSTLEALNTDRLADQYGMLVDGGNLTASASYIDSPRILGVTLRDATATIDGLHVWGMCEDDGIGLYSLATTLNATGLDVRYSEIGIMGENTSLDVSSTVTMVSNFGVGYLDSVGSFTDLNTRAIGTTAVVFEDSEISISSSELATGGAPGTVVVYAEGNSRVWVDNSTVRSASVGLHAQPGTLIRALGCDFGFTGGDILGTGSGRVEVLNLIRVRLTYNQVNAAGGAEWWEDDQIVYQENFTGYSSFYPMTHRVSTNSTTSHADLLVTARLMVGGSARERVVVADMLRTIHFNWGIEDVPDDVMIADLFEDDLGTWNIIVAVIIWALLALVWHLGWLTRQQRVWATIIGLVASVVVLLWGSISSGEWPIHLIVPLAIVGAAVGLYLWRGIGRGYEMLLFGAAGGLALVTYLWLAGHVWAIWGLAMAGIGGSAAYYLWGRGMLRRPGDWLGLAAGMTVVGVGLALVLGLWYPGMLLTRGVAELTDTLAPDTGWWFW